MQQKSTVVDKDYVPRVGDVLSNYEHPLITIEVVYERNRYSSRVNRNYNDQLFKYEVLQKIIQRKEIIWHQHKYDLQLFPTTNTSIHPTLKDRDNLTYPLYLFYNDNQQYHRLYASKYHYKPTTKVSMVIGTKTVVRASHALCTHQQVGSGVIISCDYWYGKRATALTYLVNHNYIYKGNIYDDIMLPAGLKEADEMLKIVYNES
jgi:hypothetical protein